MEAEGYIFPPIDPCISPENDWHRFERWLMGKSLRQKLRDQLPSSFKLMLSVELTDDQLSSALQKLIEVLNERENWRLDDLEE